MSSDSRQCAKCIKSNVKCDAASPSLRDQEHLQHKEERLLRKIELAISQAQEAIAKQLCVSKQQRLLKSCSGEMLYQGLKTLNELEEAEERKQQETEACSVPPTPVTTNPRGASPKHNYLLALSPRFFNCQSVDSRTLPATLGS